MRLQMPGLASQFSGDSIGTSDLLQIARNQNCYESLSLALESGQFGPEGKEKVVSVRQTAQRR